MGIFNLRYAVAPKSSEESKQNCSENHNKRSDKHKKIIEQFRSLLLILSFQIRFIEEE